MVLIALFGCPISYFILLSLHSDSLGFNRNILRGEIQMKPIENYIECPFYLREKEKEIFCEGLIENTIVIHHFETNKLKKEHERNVCSIKLGKKCPHYQAVNSKYQ